MRMSLQKVAVYAKAVLKRVKIIGHTVHTKEDGQSMVEYSILAALIAVVAMGAVQALGGGVSQVFLNILGRIQGMG